MRRALDRRLLLLVAVAVLAPAAVATRALESVHRATREQLALEWSRRGDDDLVAGRPAIAVDDYRTALTYRHDDPAYRLRLAQALMAAQHPMEAESHLLTLWSEQPGNGTINLELGRLAADRFDMVAALRYYHGAIDGSWDRDAGAARRDVRLELANVLLAHADQLRAQAELIALIGDLPADTRLVTDVADLLSRAGADARALMLCDRALTLDPANARAARLAGDIAFREANYRAAERYLAQAANGQALDGTGQTLLDVSGRILALDPYARGIETRTRALRAARAFDVARARLDRCVAAAPRGSAPLPVVAALTERAKGLARRARPRELARDADLFDETMAAVFDIEALDAECGARSTDDRALQLVSRERPGSAR